MSENEVKKTNKIIYERRHEVTGLEAIAASNGWSISVIGVSIVFTGLTVLSIIISQLHKVLDFWDQRHSYFQKPVKEEKVERKIKMPIVQHTQDVKESARQYKLLADMIGEPFALPKLLEYADKCGLTRPHSTLNDLIRSKIIVPDGEGYYRWNP